MTGNVKLEEVKDIEIYNLIGNIDILEWSNEVHDSPHPRIKTSVNKDILNTDKFSSRISIEDGLMPNSFSPLILKDLIYRFVTKDIPEIKIAYEDHNLMMQLLNDVIFIAARCRKVINGNIDKDYIYHTSYELKVMEKKIKSELVNNEIHLTTNEAFLEGLDKVNDEFELDTKDCDLIMDYLLISSGLHFNGTNGDMRVFTIRCKYIKEK